jgi:dTDP-4-amino-4,6-dideoxygalactose transaminase
MRIKFGELNVDPEALKHLKDCVKTSWISGGPKVRLLEEKWGNLFNYNHNLAVNSGTSADMAACMTLYEYGAKEGDEVIAPALAFAAVGNSIRASGLKPTFVDVEKETLNINPDLIEQKITPRTRAIMAVHTMGKPCNMEKIMGLSRKYDLKIIEDCCEAHGGKLNDKFIGSYGDVASFSFYVAHIVSCGDGGMLSTNDPEMFDLLRSVKEHGRKPGTLYFDHIRYGLNFRMNDLTASIGIPEVDRFNDTFSKRKQNFYRLRESLSDLENLAYFVEEEEGEVLSPHAFSITLKDPSLDYKKFYEYLESNGVQCKRNFGSMPTQHRAFEYLGHKLGEFPESEYIGNNGLHFGIHQHLSKEDIDYTSDLIHKYFKKAG